MIDNSAIWRGMAQKRKPMHASDIEWFYLLVGMTCFLVLVVLLLTVIWLDTRQIEKELFSKPAAASAQL
ncbi:MAG: hypothetical protein GX410_11135 [Elusimicrobia bacterium]|nr:hypothetical protein [Elusimicrobiota bacterium]